MVRSITGSRLLPRLNACDGEDFVVDQDDFGWCSEICS